VQKIIFILFNLVWDLTHQMKRNFEHLIHETRPHKCVPENSKKKEMKSENYEICQYLMISYVEAMVKIWVDFAILSRAMLTNGNICEEESESWKECG